jgi:hypothetical protein
VARLVVAQDLDNLPSQPSILHFLSKGVLALKKIPGVNFFFLSPGREPTYIRHITIYGNSCDIAIVENIPRLPPV